jgi:hypothetical protein
MIDAKEVQYYDVVQKMLLQNQAHKAAKLVELGKISWDADSKQFLCAPIEGYNKTTYHISRSDIMGVKFECDCQGFQTKLNKVGEDGAICSHVAAIYLWFRQQHARKTGTLMDYLG